MYLIFFWVKREKTNKQKKNSVLGEKHRHIPES